MRVGATLASPAATVGDVAMAQEQPVGGWHSPVPYLFGGLAAMLALIAIALLLLACSYWKLSAGHLDSGDGDGNTSLSEKEEVAEAAISSVLVIMAGQVVPTFLASATPSTSRCSSFGDTSTTTTGSDTARVQAMGSQDQIRRGYREEDGHDRFPQ